MSNKGYQRLAGLASLVISAIIVAVAPEEGSVLMMTVPLGLVCLFSKKNLFE